MLSLSSTDISSLMSPPPPRYTLFPYTTLFRSPTRNAAYPGNAGFNDAFVTKLGPFGTNLIYSTYLGGGGDDSGRAIADRKHTSELQSRQYLVCRLLLEKKK